MRWFKDDDCYVYQNKNNENVALILEVCDYPSRELAYWQCEVLEHDFVLPSCVSLNAVKSVLEILIKEIV